jgi:hypothetical protein
MGVGMEKSRIEQLRQVRNDTEVDQGTHIVTFTLRQLFAVNPFRNVNSAGRVGWVVLRNDNHGQANHLFGNSNTIFAFQIVVEFLIKTKGEFIQQGHGIQSLTEGGNIPQEHAQFPSQVQIQGYRLQHKRSLHLDRHNLSRRSQSSLVDLTETGGGHWFRCNFRKDLVAIFESYDGTLSQSFCSSTMDLGLNKSGRILKAWPILMKNGPKEVIKSRN